VNASHHVPACRAWGCEWGSRSALTATDAHGARVIGSGRTRDESFVDHDLSVFVARRAEARGARANAWHES
jgi:hypothetical protein